MLTDLRQLHDAILDLVGFINSPQPDAALIREAGVELDRALFPLMVRIGGRGPIGVGELAELVGRDYTTVSRQVARLESMGLVARRPAKRDRRVHEATVTAAGREMARALDKARDRLLAPMLSKWNVTDRQHLVRLMRRLADDVLAWSRQDPEGKLYAPSKKRP